METIFMNSKNSKTSEPHRFKSDLTDKLNLKDPKKKMALANFSIYYTWKNIKSEYNNNEVIISASTWNDTFDLTDGSYSIADMQEYFEFVIKKHETLAENLPVQIYVNKIKNRIVFKIKMGYKFKLLSPETMELLGRLELESVEVILVHSNLVKNDYEQHIKHFIHFCSKVLINISPHSLTMMNTSNTEFTFVEVWFTDQVSKVLEIEDNVNLALIIG